MCSNAPHPPTHTQNRPVKPPKIYLALKEAPRWQMFADNVPNSFALTGPQILTLPRGRQGRRKQPRGSHAVSQTVSTQLNTWPLADAELTSSLASIGAQLVCTKADSGIVKMQWSSIPDGTQLGNNPSSVYHHYYQCCLNERYLLLGTPRIS